MIRFDLTQLEAVIETAKRKAAANARCASALNRAVIELESNPYLEWNAAKQSLLILSPSGAIYEASAAPSGKCQCAAWKHSQICWHRALARLVSRYFESEIAPTAPAAVPAKSAPTSRGTLIPKGTDVFIKPQKREVILEGFTI